MKKSILLTGMLGIAIFNINATTLFVKQGGNGTGTSWKDAIGDLNAALTLAEPGDQVWIAKGTYLPTAAADRKATFFIPSGVKVYGGFEGNETSLQQRNILSNNTVLSGNIGSKTASSDNVFSVIYMKNVDGNTLLDGLVIADGFADGTGPTADRQRCGGGLFVDGSGKGNSSNPTIQNCIFQNNFARDGGAAYFNGRAGECNPILRNCQFLNNKADFDGGAVFNDGRHEGVSSPHIEDCSFINNTGNYGGAVCNYGGKGESNPNMQNCVFRNNEAYLKGGAIYNMDIEGIARPVVNGCQFVDNKAVTGKGIYTFSKGTKEMEGEKVSASYKLN